MRRLSLRRALWSQEGVALPVTLFVLLLFASLTAAFAVLSATEPQITNNLRQGNEVLALAEAGVEDAIWALTNPVAAGWATFPAMPPPARYNGGNWVVFGNGAYSVTITAGPGPNEFTVASVGRIPNTANPTATKQITVTLMSFSGRINPPAAISVKGQLDVGKDATIDARVSTCGNKLGSYTKDPTTIDLHAQVLGGDANNTPNQSTDYAQNQPASSFDPFTFTQAELNTLKALAKANGTYYQGTVNFNKATQVPNGIVFVDTVSGNPIGDPPNATDLASLTITKNSSDPPVSGQGWLIVMGSITFDGDADYTGLVYAANDFVSGKGGQITGALISLNVLDSVSTTIDSQITGKTAKITYDCNAINTGVATGGTGSPIVPQGYFVKPGTWRQVSG